MARQPVTNKNEWAWPYGFSKRPASSLVKASVLSVICPLGNRLKSRHSKQYVPASFPCYGPWGYWWFLKGHYPALLSIAVIKPWPKSNVGRKGCICLAHSDPSPSLKELKAGTGKQSRGSQSSSLRSKSNSAVWVAPPNSTAIMTSLYSDPREPVGFPPCCLPALEPITYSKFSEIHRRIHQWKLNVTFSLLPATLTQTLTRDILEQEDYTTPLGKGNPEGDQIFTECLHFSYEFRWKEV